MDLVEGESKRWARVKVVEETVAQIEAGMRRHGLKPPPPVDRIRGGKKGAKKAAGNGGAPARRRAKASKSGDA